MNVYQILWEELYNAMCKFDTKDTLTVGSLLKLMYKMKRYLMEDFQEDIEEGEE